MNFVHADMREMAFEKQFDGAYSMLTSFGYFDEETNLRVAERIGRALKPGGRFLLDILNRDYVVADLPVRVWWEGTGCVVLEEVDFNFHTSRINTHRSIVFEDGRQLEQELSVRAYSLHEIGRLLRQAGFRVIDVSGGFGDARRLFRQRFPQSADRGGKARRRRLIFRPSDAPRRHIRKSRCAAIVLVSALPILPGVRNLQPKRRRKHLSLRGVARSDPEYFSTQVRISLTGPEGVWTREAARWR